MNPALPALLIVLGLLPGMAFVKSYFAGRFPRRIAGLSPLTEFALYIAVALPIDTIAVSRLNLQPQGVVLGVRLVTGTVVEQHVERVAASLTANWREAVVLYLVVLGLAVIAGAILRRVVWTFRLDVRAPVLRMRHPWYYTLQGRLPGLPRDVVAWVDVLAEVPGETPRLYRGIVKEFETDSSGEVTELVVGNTLRGKGRGDEFQFVLMPSHRFLICGRFIHSINVSYDEVVYEEETRWQRIGRVSAAYLRSFAFEEP